MDEDAMLAQWQQLSAQACQMAEHAAADPVYLAGLDLTVEPAGEGELPKAKLLLACARKIIPEAFDYDVVAAMGSHVHLVLKKLNPQAAPDSEPLYTSNAPAQERSAEDDRNGAFDRISAGINMIRRRSNPAADLVLVTQVVLNDTDQAIVYFQMDLNHLDP